MKMTTAVATTGLTLSLVLTGCGSLPDPCENVKRATPGEIASANAGREIEAEGRGGVDCVLDEDGVWVEEEDD